MVLSINVYVEILSIAWQVQVELWRNFFLSIFQKLNHFPCSHDNWIYNAVKHVKPSYSAAETLFSC